jgi:hypothetical protein
MFQLAFAHATAARLGTTYVYGRPPFKETELGPPLWKLFDIGPWASPFTRARRYAEFLARYGHRARIVEIEQDAEPEEAIAGLREGIVYTGFYQSERWFSGHEEAVRRMFTPLPEHEAEFRRRYPDLERPYVCIHVRRTDYLETGVWALPTSWFLDALAALPGIEGHRIVVVSDDPEGVRSEFAGHFDGVFDANSQMVDLLLLMEADAVITSNSSFSWWGAWLNRRQAPVVAPRHWLGFAAGREEPRGAVPDRWISVPVRDAPLVGR